jgi:hypothetical protein
MANAELERLGFDVRIDRRTFAEQGIDQIPTVHMGVAAMQMERRGIRTERGDMNRKIEITNQEIRQLRARIIKLDKWIAVEAKNDAPPTLADVISNILNRPDQSSLTRLKIAAPIVLFLKQNNIPDFAGLERKVDSMNSDIRMMGKNLNDISRRINTLDLHLAHSQNLKKYRKIHNKQTALYDEYRRLDKQGFLFKGKAKEALATAEAYDWKYLNELQDYENAEKYLRGVLQDRYDPKKLPPITMGQEQREAKIAERAALTLEYNKLKTETQKVEQIRRSVADILHSDEPKPTRTKSRGMEL